MKIANFRRAGEASRLGVVVNEGIIDLSVVLPNLPRDMTDLLAAGDDAMNQVRSVANGKAHFKLSDVELLAPIPNPPEFLAIGLNYGDHLAETGRDKPEFPWFFNKQKTCIVGPNADVHRPKVSEKLDYEGELGFVIGKACRHVPKEKAASVIAGFVNLNDVSVRDWQRKAPTWTMGKSFDTHGPMGPWMVTSDEVGDPHNLSLKTILNGKVVQESNTKNLIFDCYEQVAILSTAFTLLPGTVIATGTCGGVGAARTPQLFMKPGDIVQVEIEKLGTLENRIIEEPNDTVRY
jgi:2-keto-4-pentenoate hydratase/2-oxohepta-3-ene-1,7-dioic acid hydratase in catechol pathway